MDIGETLRKHFKETGGQNFHIEGDIWLVPCMANYIQNEFRPLLKPVSNNASGEVTHNKQGWTENEEEILLKIVNSRGAKAWSSVAKELNTMLHDGHAVRQGRHCRERWYNHVNPELKKGNWTEEEDNFIIAQHNSIGNKWSEISKLMEGRTENSVKNRYKSLAKRHTVGEQQEFQSPFCLMTEKQMEITMQPANFNTLLLMSPQIVNFTYDEPGESPKNNNFVRPTPVLIRPIRSKTPGPKQISETKQRLKQELLNEGTPSPSAFLRFGN